MEALHVEDYRHDDQGLAGEPTTHLGTIRAQFPEDAT